MESSYLIYVVGLALVGWLGRNFVNSVKEDVKTNYNKLAEFMQDITKKMNDINISFVNVDNSIKNLYKDLNQSNKRIGIMEEDIRDNRKRISDHVHDLRDRVQTIESVKVITEQCLKDVDKIKKHLDIE